MFSEYLGALSLIFIAEMGDKTQILSMAFATKYKIKNILAGVAIGSFLNHGLAIMLGALLTRFVPIEMLQTVAGIMFIVFAIWSLDVDEDDEEEGSGVSKYGPIFTVALAFFLGELGDKTQLTALTLASSSKYPAIILAGTVSGMVLTSMIGILVGSKLGSKIPEFKLKMGAFLIFMFFGIQKLYVSPYTYMVNSVIIGIGILVLAALCYFRINDFRTKIASVEKSKLAKQAEDLYTFTHQINDLVLKMCHGEGSCVKCSGEKCLVGFLKATINNSLNNNSKVDNVEAEKFKKMLNKDFSKEKAFEILEILIKYYEKYPSEYLESKPLMQIRMSLEVIIFGEVLKQQNTIDEYISKVRGKAIN